MKEFLDHTFLLQSPTAERLFHEYAAQMPIIDYHCHLDPALIAADHRFDNITEAWLKGDHYKWRAMRANGIEEQFITGDSPDEEKFDKWAETVPYTIRNPLFHWTHLELRRYFGIEALLAPATSREIFQTTSAALRTSNFSVRGLLEKMKVELVCTTDDPVDSLEHHKTIAHSEWNIEVRPAWRPDQVLAIDNRPAFLKYLVRLSESTNLEINTYQKLLEALRKRHDYFHAMGCRLSDHGLRTMYCTRYSDHEIGQAFNRVVSGAFLCQEDAMKFKSAMLYELALMNHEKGWVQQYHLGPMRNTNSRMMEKVGPDTGFDSIGDLPMALPLSQFLNRLDRENRLTKTIIYNLNPSDNEVIATMTGNFQDGSIPGKIQWGSAWWFLDQKDGMEKQLNTLSTMGLLSRFVGMLTDSRSFLSFPRHEYFRRILCNLIGRDVENGELPNDIKWLGKVVQDICYYNAKQYF